MDRQKFIDIVAAVSSDGPRGTVGHATAALIADALHSEHVQFREEPKAKQPTSHASETDAQRVARLGGGVG